MHHQAAAITILLLLRADPAPTDVQLGDPAEETAPVPCDSKPGCPDRDLLASALRTRSARLHAFLWEPVDLEHGPGLSAPHEGAITSPFGPRMHPVLGYRRNHNGVDISARHGEPVGAAGPGRVLRAGWRGGYGNSVEVDHGGGLTTLYAHLERIDVTVGQDLHRLQRLGAVGSTGLSTGPHLHYEVRIDGQPVDPAPHLPGAHNSR